MHFLKICISGHLQLLFLYYVSNLSFLEPATLRSLEFFGKPELLFLIPIITGILGLVFLKSQNSADKKLRLLVASKFIEDLVPLFSKKENF